MGVPQSREEHDDATGTPRWSWHSHLGTSRPASQQLKGEVTGHDDATRRSQLLARSIQSEVWEV